jgi:alkanesulfonate monooxygenase SsuD/methylene tetrahydromethanopterin reductase-like flavin-dependent oxidoreductase (luciferase family)
MRLMVRVMVVTVGVVFRPQQPPEDLEAVVRAVDEAGVPELWLWEDCFLEGGLTTATAALAWSQRVRVGIGLLPVPLRNPALVAMEVATVARLFPGRFVPAVGHGVLDWMAQVGARAESPMTLLREHTVAVRDLLEGRRVDVEGRYVRLDGVALDWPPVDRPTLLVGARGDKSVRLAGEVADGVLLDGVSEADAVRRGRRLVDEGREASGRSGRALVTLYTEVDTAQPRATVAAQVGERVAAFREAGADTVVLQATGERPDPRPLVEALAAAGLLT